MSDNNRNIFEEDNEESLRECSIKNINLSEQAYCANKLGKLYYGYADTMPLSIKYYMVAYNIDSDNPEYIHNLSRAYYLIEDFEKAELFLKKCIEVDVPSLEKSICAAKLSYIYYNKKRNLEAISFLELAHKFEPKNPQYIYSLALRYERIGNYTQAESLLKKCFNAEEANISDKYVIANCAITLGDMYSDNKMVERDINKILFSYSTAYNLVPNDPVNLMKAALAFYKFGIYKVAKMLFEECVDSKNNQTFTDVIKARCANWLGNLYLSESSSYEESTTNAVRAYSIAKELDSKNPIYNYNLALAYYKFNSNYSKTSLLLEECLNANYTESFTSIEKSRCANKLGTLYYNLKLQGLNTQDSANQIIKYYKLAYELNNDNAYLYNLGMSLFYSGKYTDAIPIIKVCKENNDNSFNIEMQKKCYEIYLDLIGIYISKNFYLDSFTL